MSVTGGCPDECTRIVKGGSFPALITHSKCALNWGGAPDTKA